jgi:hypothetical protein
VSQLRHSERAYYILAEILRGRKMSSSQTIGSYFSAHQFFCQNCLRPLGGIPLMENRGRKLN